MSDSKAISPMETFQENLKKSLRDDIARMLPEEAVQEMIKRVIEDEFFKKRVIDDPTDHSSWNRRKIEKGTEFQNIVMGAAMPMLEKLAAKWIADNQEELLKQWQNIVNEGLMTHVAKLQEAKATAQIKDAFNKMIEAMNQERSKSGEPMLPVIY